MEYVIVGLIVVAVVYFSFFKKDDKDVSAPAPAPAPAPVSPPAEQKKLPTATKLKAMTKAGLEDLGRDFGVELDKRKTKDKMIADLKSGVKAQLK